MNGIIIIDKPNGPTSNQISIWVKQILNEKTAHSGTLDPNVTGVLPILVGNKGIKLLEYLQLHDKEYICLMKAEKEIEKDEMQKVLNEFVGKIYQTPPEMSAVAKNTRIRKIYEIKLIQKKDNFYLFSVYCQHGTYIRTLVEDVGKVLGIKTEMSALRRINSGPFREKEAISLVELQDAVVLMKKKPELFEKMLKPLEYAVQKLPKAVVRNNAVKNIANGSPVYRTGLVSLTGHIVKDTAVAVFDENERLISIGIAITDKKSMLSMDKGEVMKTKKVLK